MRCRPIASMPLRDGSSTHDDETCIAATVSAAIPRSDSMRGMNRGALLLNTTLIESPPRPVFQQASAGIVVALWLRQAEPPLRHRIDEAVARIGMALPARLQHVAQQEAAGEQETVPQILLGPAIDAIFAAVSALRLGLSFTLAFTLAQERRQPQQFVTPGLAGRARHRAAGLRRYIDQIGGLAGRGAVVEIKPEAELCEHRKLEPDHTHRCGIGIIEIIQRAIEHLIQLFMRIRSEERRVGKECRTRWSPGRLKKKT